MHKLCLSLALVFGTLSSALAQLSVEVRLEQDQFLAGEQVVAAVRITNRSGQTIRLGADEDWLAISVEGLDGKLLPSFSDPPVAGEFELETSKVGTKRVNLLRMNIVPLLFLLTRLKPHLFPLKFRGQ